MAEIMGMLFRYRCLLMLLTLGSILVGDGGTAWMVVIALTMSQWVMVVRAFRDNAVYGGYVQHAATAVFSADTAEEPFSRDATSRAAEFAWRTILLVAGVIVSSAATFDRLHAVSGGTAFSGVPYDDFTLLHFLYFSIVTLSTTGFGDIHPSGENVWAQMAVASEIGCGFVILTVTLALVALTFGNDSREGA